jgi:hypothetical protein
MKSRASKKPQKLQKLQKLLVCLEIPVWVTWDEARCINQGKGGWAIVRERALLEARLHGEEYVATWLWEEP